MLKEKTYFNGETGTARLVDPIHKHHCSVLSYTGVLSGGVYLDNGLLGKDIKGELTPADYSN